MCPHVVFVCTNPILPQILRASLWKRKRVAANHHTPEAGMPFLCAMPPSSALASRCSTRQPGAPRLFTSSARPRLARISDASD